MKVVTYLIAGLGLAGGIGMVALTPAVAATPGAQPSVTSTGTTPSAPAPTAPQASHRVAVLQEALDSEGAHLRLDGVWGPATEAALTQFQRQHGLQPTGKLDQATRTQLDPIG